GAKRSNQQKGSGNDGEFVQPSDGKGEDAHSRKTGRPHPINTRHDLQLVEEPCHTDNNGQNWNNEFLSHIHFLFSFFHAERLPAPTCSEARIVLPSYSFG